MPEHHTPLIATIAGSLVLAFILGLAAHQVKVSPLVGYLLAGIVIGPFTPGFVADQGQANELAEIGVILLMFAVGLHFSLKDLMAVRAIALPGALAGIGVGTLLGMALAHSFGWSLAAGLVFGLALSVASTVVLMRALQERRILETERGHIAVGWVIVEDLAMVVALVLLPAIGPGVAGGSAGGGAEGAGMPAMQLAITVAATLAKVSVFVAIMLVAGRRAIPWVMHYAAHTGSRELFRLAVYAVALGVAFAASELFGVSFALGAFFAGMVMGESKLSQRATEEALPLRDAFAVLFFVSVGMLFDPHVLVTAPLAVLAVVGIIVVGKPLAAYLIVRAFGHPPGTALTIAASLAQVGEFSFILAGLGVATGILPAAGRDLVLAGAILSILLNPLLFAAVERGRVRRLPPAREAPAGPAREPGTNAATARRTAPQPLPATAGRDQTDAARPGTPAAGVAKPDQGPTGAAEVRPAPAVRPPRQPAGSIGAASGGQAGLAKAGGAAAASASATPAVTRLEGHEVIIGYGRVGSILGSGLAAAGLPVLVFEEGEDAVEAARRDGAEVVVGNAADPEVLAAANLGAARRLFVTIPQPFEAGQVVEQARAANPALEILARAHSAEAVEHLNRLGATLTVMGEREIAQRMLESALGRPGGG